jgi:hypothetical protein
MIAPHWADANKPHFPCSGSRRRTEEPVNQSRPGSPSHLLDSRLQGYELDPFFQITDCNASLSKLKSASTYRLPLPLALCGKRAGQILHQPWIKFHSGTAINCGSKEMSARRRSVLSE